MLHDQEGAAIQVRVGGPLFERLENWRRSQPKIPHRSDALRSLLEALAASDAATATDKGGAAMSPELSKLKTAQPPPKQPVTSLEPAASVARRLGRSVRTIERWVKAGILPPPMQVNGRNLHRAGVMPKPDDA